MSTIESTVQTETFAFRVSPSSQSNEEMHGIDFHSGTNRRHANYSDEISCHSASQAWL